MFTNLYNFFFEWLFASQYPSFISQQTAELVCVAMCVITIIALINLVLIPIRALLRFGGI